MRMLLQGDALCMFESKATGLQESHDNFTVCKNTVTHHVFPCHALLQQKQYMCCYVHKLLSLKMCKYVATVVERCNDLKYFPDYMATDKFNDDELCNIVKFGSPPVWQNMMLIQGFNITDHTLDELVKFCEHLESVEEILNLWKKSMMLT